MSALIDSTRAELLRLRRWPAMWVLLGVWVTLNVTFGYVFDYVAYRTGEPTPVGEGAPAEALLSGLLPAAAPLTLVQGMPMFGGALVMILGALAVGSGYGWGTWKTVFTQGPSRAAVVLGSIAALCVLVAGIVLATLISDAGMSLAVALQQSHDVTWPGLSDLVQSVGGSLLVMEMWALAGYFLGVVARGPAVSVGLGLVWALVIEQLLRGVGTSLNAVAVFTHFLPGTAAGSLIGSIVGAGGPEPTPGIIDTLSGGRALVTMTAWIVLLPLASLWLTRQRDVA
jgi:ABC-2 type transport system permease protein